MAVVILFCLKELFPFSSLFQQKYSQYLKPIFCSVFNLFILLTRDLQSLLLENHQVDKRACLSCIKSLTLHGLSSFRQEIQTLLPKIKSVTLTVLFVVESVHLSQLMTN